MVGDKENTYHKTQKGKPIPKQKHRYQNGNTRTRITKYNIESYNLKKKLNVFLHARKTKQTFKTRK